MLYLFWCLALCSITTTADFAVVAYLPEWRFEGANWDTISQHVSHLILFSLEMSANGIITAKDRLPRPELLQEAKAAAEKHGTHLLICFGGNGRSHGFSAMTRNPDYRKRFIKSLVKLMKDYGFHGVDYNWEYPGYHFGKGYLPQEEIEADYKGLGDLMKETKAAFARRGKGDIITFAYYPDGRQEELIKKYGLAEHAALMHMMSYDQTDGHHSTLEFGKKAVALGVRSLPPHQLTMGLPFYGRTPNEWVTYEDIVQKNHPLDPETDEVGGKLGFNGVNTIVTKTRHAIQQKLGGVMIWEVGQDCRLFPVKHGTTEHVSTCPNGEDSSLLVAISRAMQVEGVTLERRVKVSLKPEL
jgi:GH18 family chitinase